MLRSFQKAVRDSLCFGDPTGRLLATTAITENKEYIQYTEKKESTADIADVDYIFIGHVVVLKLKFLSWQASPKHMLP